MAKKSVAPEKNTPFFLRKITPKEVTDAIGDINLLALPRPVESRVLYDIFGVVRFATILPDKSGQGRGDSIRLSGKFKAVTPDEYVFESGRAFIPVMDEILYTSLQAAKEVDPNAYLEIAFRVAIEQAPTDKPSMTGYEFNVQRLIFKQAEKDDPIERLMLEAKESQAKRLAAPAVNGGAGTDPGQGAVSTQGEGSGDVSTTTGQAPAGSPAPSTDSEGKKNRHRASA